MCFRTHRTKMNERQNRERGAGVFCGRSDNNTKLKRSPGSFSAKLAIGAARLFAKSLPAYSIGKEDPVGISSTKRKSSLTSLIVNDKSGIKTDDHLLREDETIEKSSDGVPNIDEVPGTKQENEMSNINSENRNSRERENIIPVQGSKPCKTGVSKKIVHSGKPSGCQDLPNRKSHFKYDIVNEEQDCAKHLNSKDPEKNYSDRKPTHSNISSTQNIKIRRNFSSPGRKKKDTDQKGQALDHGKSLSSFGNKLADGNIMKKTDTNECLAFQKEERSTESLNFKSRKCNLPKQAFSGSCSYFGESTGIPALDDCLLTGDERIGRNSNEEEVIQELSDDWNTDHYDLSAARASQAQISEPMSNVDKKQANSLQGDNENINDSLSIKDEQTTCCNMSQVIQNNALVRDDTSEQKLQFTYESSDTDSVCSSGSGGRGRGRGRGRCKQGKQETSPGFRRAQETSPVGYSMNSLLSQEDTPQARFWNDSNLIHSPGEDWSRAFNSHSPGEDYSLAFNCNNYWCPPTVTPDQYLPPRPTYDFGPQLRPNSQRKASYNENWSRFPRDPRMFRPPPPGQVFPMRSPCARNSAALRQNKCGNRENVARMHCRNPRERLYCPSPVQFCPPPMCPPPGIPSRSSSLFSNNPVIMPPPGFPAINVKSSAVTNKDSTNNIHQAVYDVEWGTKIAEDHVEDEVFNENIGQSDATTERYLNSPGAEEWETPGRGLKRIRSPPRSGELQKRTEISEDDIKHNQKSEESDGISGDLCVDQNVMNTSYLGGWKAIKEDPDKNEEIQPDIVPQDQQSPFERYNYRRTSISPGWLTPNAKDDSKEKTEGSNPPEINACRELNMMGGEEKTDFIDKDTGEYVSGRLSPKERVTDDKCRESSFIDKQMDMWKQESDKHHVHSKEFWMNAQKSNHLMQGETLSDAETLGERSQSKVVGSEGFAKPSYTPKVPSERNTRVMMQDICSEVKEENLYMTQVGKIKPIQVDFNSNVVHRDDTSQVQSEADNDEVDVVDKVKTEKLGTFSGCENVAYSWPVAYSKSVNSHELCDQPQKWSPFSSELTPGKKRSQSDSILFSSVGDTNVERRELLSLGSKYSSLRSERDILPEGVEGDVKIADIHGQGWGCHTRDTKNATMLGEKTSANLSGIQLQVAEARVKKQQALELNRRKACSMTDNVTSPETVVKHELGCQSAEKPSKYVIPQRRTSLSPELARNNYGFPAVNLQGIKKEVPSVYVDGPSIVTTPLAVYNIGDTEQKVINSTPQGPPSGYEASESDNDEKNKKSRQTKEVKFKVKAVRQKQRLSLALSSASMYSEKEEESSSGGDMDWYDMKKVKGNKAKSDSKLERSKRRIVDDMVKASTTPFWSADKTAALFMDKNKSDNMTVKNKYGFKYEESTPSIESQSAFPSLRDRRSESVSSGIFSFSRLNSEEFSRPQKDSYSERLKSRYAVKSKVVVPQTELHEVCCRNKLESVQWRNWKDKFQETYKFVKTSFIDTHCHIDFLFERSGFKGTYREYIEKNKDTFVPVYEGCVAIFCNPRTFSPENALWKSLTQESGVRTAIGCHPKSATDFSPRYELGMRKMLDHPNVVALGEIGLDYSGTFQQHAEVQKYVLIKQCKIAQEKSLPLIIHSRNSEQDIIEVLEENIPRNYKIHRHCFTGSWAEAEDWLKKFPNSYIGLTPLITWYNAERAQAPREVARKIPLNKLLLETDAPYFVPKRIPREEVEYSHPGFAITVAYEVAKIKGVPLDRVLQECRDNTYDMYGI